MARGGITLSDVDRAARYLQGQGKNPTIDAIRQYLGTGSRTTLAELLKQWKAEQAEGAAGNLPESLLALVNGLWKNLQTQAEERIEKHQETSDQEINQLKDQLATAKSNEAQLQQQLDQLKTEANNKQQAYAELKKFFQQSEKNYDKMSASYELTSKQLENAKQENQRLHQLATQIQNNLEHYQEFVQKQQYEQKVAWERQQAAYQLEISQLKNTLQQAKIQQEKYQEDILTHQLKLSNFQEDYDKIKSEHQILLEKNKGINDLLIKTKIEKESLGKQKEGLLQELITEKKLNQSLNQQLAVLSEKLERSQSDFSKAEDQIKALNHEKIFLIQEKAQLEGVLKQLQKTTLS